MDGAYDPGIHAAQCLAYVHVKNKSFISEDFNKSIWIGVGSFDNRDAGGISIEPDLGYDGGTKTYMYCVSDTDAFGNVDLFDGQWHPCLVNIKKAVSDALEALKAKGEMTKSKVNDFVVDEFNYGWELPGTFDVTSKMRNLSLIAF